MRLSERRRGDELVISPSVAKESRALTDRVGGNLHWFRSAVQWCLRHPLGPGQWVALAGWLLVLAGTMIVMGDHIAGTTNQVVQHYDQSAYLNMVEKNRDAWWPAWTDGVRNPLFPWVLGKVEGDRSALFAAGLKLNVRLGALLLLALGAWAGRRLPVLAAIMFATLVGPGIFLPISTYLGAEVLFYGFFFSAWILGFALLARLTFARCALFGVAVTLAYLAKPAVSLMVVSLCGTAALRWLLMWRAREAQGWSGWRPIAGATIALAVAASIATPRMLEAWKVFGDPLQNTSANHLWEENWATTRPKLSYLNPRLIHNLPEAERPTAERFFRKHGWSGFRDRLLRGMSLQAEHVFLPDRKALWFTRTGTADKPVRRIFPYRGFFLLPPLVLIGCFGAVLIHRKGLAAIPPAAWCQMLFALLLIGGSIGAFGWYSPFAPGARFILGLYAPVLASLLVGADSLRRQLASLWADSLFGGSCLLAFALFTMHLALICRNPVFGTLRNSF